jgi:phage shock protein A
MKAFARPLLFLLLAVFAACTPAKDEIDAEIKAIDEKITKMEAQLDDFKERIKAADSDRGLRDQLAEDQALLKSRLERLRERLKLKRPTPSPDPAF